MLLKEKRVLLCVRNVFATLRDSCFEEFKLVFDQMCITNMMRIREHDLSITFPNGSKIIFKGCDSEEKLLSISNVSDCWMEEAYEIPKNVIEQLFLRVRRNDIQTHFFFSFNPISKANYMYELIHDEKILEQGFVHKSTYKDNAFLSPDYIAQLEDLKRTNYQKYQVYCLGEFGTLGKQVFENWRVDESLNVEELYKQGLSQRIGIDFGFSNDPATLCVSLVDERNKKIYIVDEIYETGLLNEDLAKRIKAKGYENEIIYCDSAEPKSIEQLKRYGIRKAKGATKGKGSINAGIDLLQTYEIIVAGHCKHMAEELANYTWKKNRATGEYENTPIDAYNHLIDALRYSMSPYLDSLKSARVMSKAILGL